MGSDMGKKHSSSKPGVGRTNAIFKIAGANFKDKKSGKPKEVTSKIKLISAVNRSKVIQLDKTLSELQHSSAKAGVSLAGNKVTQVTPLPQREVKEPVREEQMDELVESLHKKT